ncbi:MAG: succinylglutamate desuccinylase [Allomuricauda sp.]|nr:MAG: succinylglutamate desuccinylase [Allomuricauda sp.]
MCCLEKEKIAKPNQVNGMFTNSLLFRKSVLIFMLLGLQHVVSQNSINDVFTNADRPARTSMKIDVSDDLGHEGYLPVSILKGKNEGPVFTIVAGVHGVEYSPIIATQQLIQEIDEHKLTGTLIFIPIASRGSFYNRTPFKNSEDDVNLNNAFPGDPKGSITQRTAALITEQIIPLSDVFLDIHSGDGPEDLLPFICYYNNTDKPKQTQRAKELSEVSGFEYVVSYPYTLRDDEPAKYAFKQAVQDGKIGVSIESGKLGKVEKADVDLTKKGVYNMLAEMEMYGDTIGGETKITRLNDQVYVRSKVKGIFYSSYQAGDAVQKGDVVGYATDEFGAVLEEYRASKTGIILYMLATPPINVGNTVMCISSNVERD